MNSPDVGSLPSGWRTAKIGDLFDSWGGHTPPKAEPSYWGDGIPWVSSRDVKTPRLKTSSHSVTAKAVAETGLKVFPAGTVLVVVRSGILAHSLPVTVTGVPVTINQDLKAFHSDEPLMNEWLAMFLRMSTNALLGSSRRDGTTVQSVQYPILKDTSVPVPPLNQRRWIIDSVGAVLAKQSDALPHLAAARRAIERFRQSVVAAACSGRLTSEWRSLRGFETQGGSTEDVPETWELTTLGELAASIRGGSTEVPIDERSKYPILRSSSVRPFGVDYEDVRFLTEDQSRRPDNFLQEGDLLITRLSGSITYVGNCALVRKLEGRQVQYPDRLFCCRLKDPSEAPHIEICFAGPTIRKQIEDASRSAAGHQRISISDLRTFRIPRPPLEEQHEITRRVDQLMALAQLLKQRIEATSKHVEHSSQAVLAKAFRGDLLPTRINGS